MFKIDNDLYKDYGYQNEYMLSFYPLENEDKIINSLDINIDKVIIYKNVGIFLYYKNIIVKVIKSKSIEIQSSNKVFKIKYDSCFVSNKLILYYNIKQNHQENNLKIGDLVIPCDIEVPIQNIDITIGEFIKKLLISLHLKENSNYEYEKEVIDSMLNLFYYKIIDIEEIDNMHLYLLELVNKEDLLKDEDCDKEKIINKIYSLSENILTKEYMYNFFKKEKIK